MQCKLDNTIRLFQSGSHSNKYDDIDKKKLIGIHRFYKAEINQLISDEPGKTPYAILKVLTKRKTDCSIGYDLTIPFPTLLQIRNYKRNIVSAPVHNNEYEQVMTLIDELSYDAERTGDKIPFTYGVKKGSGSDNEPFVVCFTSKHLLRNISKYSHHYSVFHIDGKLYYLY